jgi:hypothetical protein
MARKHLYETVSQRISIRLPDHVDMALRLEALGRRVSPSVVAAEILEAHFRETDNGRVMLAFPIQRQPEPATPKPEKAAADERRKKHAPKKFHTSNRDAAVAEGNPWTWDRLSDALESVGGHGQHREIAHALGLSNISVWAKTGVPKKWWPKIREYLIGRGWEPTEDQPLLLSPLEPEE